MKCTKCGKVNPVNKNVCTKCGAFLYSANPRNRRALTPEEKRSQRRANIKGASLGCVWSVLIIAGVFFFLGVIIFLLFTYVLPPDFIDIIAPTSIDPTQTITVPR